MSAVSELLRVRAESYARDAFTLGYEGDQTSAVMYRTIAAELRKVAAEADRLDAEGLDPSRRVETATTNSRTPGASDAHRGS